jgi:hypothetical protein
LIIDAKAGTGKTTTLKKLANIVLDSSILYLVFNKKNEIEAKKEFPKNTDVMTTNSFFGKIVYQMFKCRLKECKNMLLIPRDYYMKLEKKQQGKFKSQTSKIIEKCKSYNCSPSDMSLIDVIISEFKEEEKFIDYCLIPTS